MDIHDRWIKMLLPQEPRQIPDNLNIESGKESFIWENSLLLSKTKYLGFYLPSRYTTSYKICLYRYTHIANTCTRKGIHNARNYMYEVVEVRVRL